jgi:CheY-like chemotaxis protein
MLLVLTTDLMTQSKLTGAAAQLQTSCQFAMSAARLNDLVQKFPAAVVMIDLSAAGGSIESIVRDLRALPQPPRAIVAFGPHVHEQQLDAARNAGCDAVLTRSQVFSPSVATLLPFFA